MEKLKWTAHELKWKELIPYEFNARKIKAENKRNLIESIDEFGMAVAPTVDFDNILIGGHQRWQIMIEAGRGDESVMVSKPNRKLTEAEFKKLNLLLNSSKYQGEYDLEMLNEFFNEFNMTDFGVDLPDFSETLKDLEGPDAPEMPIVPKYSEKYSSFVIICRNEIDENHIAEKLGIEVGKCYKSSNIGPQHVIESTKLIESWK